MSNKPKSALQGAATGAATGAMIGGPWGAAIGGIGGGLMGLFGGDDTDEKIQAELAKNQQIYGDLKTPDFKQYNPSQYQQVGQYDPTMAQAKTVEQNPELQSMQMGNLYRMADLANNGLSAVDQAGYQKAADTGNSILRGGTAAALQNAESRGQGGTGSELAMREMAAQQGSQNAQNQALQQAGDSARMRALYSQAFGGAAGGLSQQQFGQNATNAGILNQFNQANTAAQNQAKQYNLGTAQGIANANVGNTNEAQKYNNQLGQQTYQDQYQKAAGMAGANTGAAQGYAAQGAADTSSQNALLGAGATLGAAYLGNKQKTPTTPAVP